MATSRAIAAAVEALAASLRRRYPREQFGDALIVEAVAPAQLRDSLNYDGIAICLWRVSVGPHLRQAPPRRAHDGRSLPATLPLDLDIIVVPHAATVQSQHELLGWVMRALCDRPVLTSAELNQAMGGNDAFSAGEAANLSIEPFDIEHILALWNRLGELPPAAFCRLGTLMLDSEEELDEGPPVVAREFQDRPDTT